MEPIATDNAPAFDELPLTQGIINDDLVFVSGQVPVDPSNGGIVAGGIREQTKQTMANVTAILDDIGVSPDDIVKTTIYLVDMSDFDDVNEVYADYFDPPYPARTAVEVSGLAIDVSIEIDVIATR